MTNFKSVSRSAANLELMGIDFVMQRDGSKLNSLSKQRLFYVNRLSSGKSRFR